MAVAAYSSSLIPISTAETTTNYTSIGGGGAITAETDFFIQGTACVSKATSATWDTAGTARGGTIFDFGSGITIPTDGAVLTWIYWWGPGVLATKAAGGAEIIIGSATTAYNSWYVTGADDWAFGGWRNYPVNTTVAVSRTATGSPTSTLQYFGWNANVGVAAAIGKGNPYGIDVIRYGRCDLISTAGDLANGYATFLGAANYDNDVTRRYGLLIPRDGAYYQQGLFLMGLAATAVDFRDSNRAIFIQNTEQVTSAFNTFEVRNTGSNISWTNINFTALGTVSKGKVIITDNATVAITSCVFTDMDTFVFKSNSNIATSTFRRCNTVTQNSATINGCVFDSPTGSAAIISNNMSLISNSTFISDGSSHAVEMTTAGTYAWTSNTVSNYAAVTGSTGNEVFYNNSGGLVTINVSGGSGVLSYRNAGISTTTINSTVAVTLTGLKDNTEVRVLAFNTNTELAGIEIATSGTTNNRSFTFSLSAATAVTIKIHSLQYEHISLDYTVPGAAASVPIQQRFDRNYLNP